MTQGVFITFEGTDGSGKSTQARLLSEFLQNRNHKVFTTREPGGTKIGEKIRKILLDKENGKMDSLTEVLLYAAARAQLIEEEIKPHLQAGDIVICDRFLDSSVAYQGGARQLKDAVLAINAFATAHCTPDVTFLLKLTPEISLSRIRKNGSDRIEAESLSWHQSVYETYLELEKQHPERIIGIEGGKSIMQTQSVIREHLQKRFTTLFDTNGPGGTHETTGGMGQ